MWIALLEMCFCPSPFISPTFCLDPSSSFFLGSSSLSRSGWLLPFHSSAGSAFPYELPHVICAGFVVVAWCLMSSFHFPSSFQPLTMSIGGTIPNLWATAEDLASSLQLSGNQNMLVEEALGFPELPHRFLLHPTDCWGRNELQATQPDVFIFR